MAETAKKPNIFQRWARSFKDMRGEMKKVVWPTKSRSSIIPSSYWQLS